MEKHSERFVFLICLLWWRLGKRFACCSCELLHLSIPICLWKLVKLQERREEHGLLLPNKGTLEEIEKQHTAYRKR